MSWCRVGCTDRAGPVAIRRDRLVSRHSIASLVKTSWIQDWVRYDVVNRYQPGIMQKTGECMVAEDLPATVIAINFVSDGISITKVEYATAYGCGDAL